MELSQLSFKNTLPGCHLACIPECEGYQLLLMGMQWHWATVDFTKELRLSSIFSLPPAVESCFDTFTGWVGGGMGGLLKIDNKATLSQLEPGLV